MEVCASFCTMIAQVTGVAFSNHATEVYQDLVSWYTYRLFQIESVCYEWVHRDQKPLGALFMWEVCDNPNVVRMQSCRI